jgi:hypothetical protein
MPTSCSKRANSWITCSMASRDVGWERTVVLRYGGLPSEHGRPRGVYHWSGAAWERSRPEVAGVERGLTRHPLLSSPSRSRWQWWPREAGRATHLLRLRIPADRLVIAVVTALILFAAGHDTARPLRAAVARGILTGVVHAAVVGGPERGEPWQRHSVHEARADIGSRTVAEVNRAQSVGMHPS